jgi:hypothetical protein
VEGHLSKHSPEQQLAIEWQQQQQQQQLAIIEQLLQLDSQAALLDTSHFMESFSDPQQPQAALPGSYLSIPCIQEQQESESSRGRFVFVRVLGDSMH